MSNFRYQFPNFALRGEQTGQFHPGNGGNSRREPGSIQSHGQHSDSVEGSADAGREEECAGAGERVEDSIFVAMRIIQLILALPCAIIVTVCLVWRACKADQ